VAEFSEMVVEFAELVAEFSVKVAELAMGFADLVGLVGARLRCCCLTGMDTGRNLLDTAQQCK
jgi:hypothetical protein